MNIRPQPSVSFDDAKNTLFGRREQVEVDTQWSVDKPGADHFKQCSNNGALVLFNPSRVVRIDTTTGKKAWEREVDSEPSVVFPAREVTVIGYRDGRMEGVGPDGDCEWNFKLPHTGHSLSFGSPDLTMLSMETWPGHQQYHMALAPATGEVLWRQPGAVFDNPIKVGEGLMLMKASNSLMCMDANSGLVRDQQPYGGYGRSLIGNEKGEAWFLDDQSVRKVLVQDGKIEDQWSIPFEPELCHMMAPADGSVLYVSAQDEIRGLDPASGRMLWSQPVEGKHYQWGIHVTDRGELLVPGADRLVCLAQDGTRRWDVSNEGSVRCTPRGILSMVDPGYPKPFKLERLDPDSGEVMYWAEIPRGTSTPWLDPGGSVQVTMKDKIEMYQLPDPEKLPPPRTQVVAERGDSVVIGGIRVKKKA